MGRLGKLEIPSGKKTATNDNCFDIKACFFLFLFSAFGFNHHCFVNLF